MSDHPLKRRQSDIEREELDESFRQCPAYANHSDVDTIHKDLQEIKKTVEEMRDIIIAWQDAKSFFKMVKVIGEVIKWVVAVCAAIGIVWYFLSGKGGK